MTRSGNFRSRERPYSYQDVVSAARRTLGRYHGDLNRAGRYARSMEDRYESSKWGAVVEYIRGLGTP